MRLRKSKRCNHMHLKNVVQATTTPKLKYIYHNNGDMSWTPYVYQPPSRSYTAWQLIAQNNYKVMHP